MVAGVLVVGEVGLHDVTLVGMASDVRGLRLFKVPSSDFGVGHLMPLAQNTIIVGDVVDVVACCRSCSCLTSRSPLWTRSSGENSGFLKFLASSVVPVRLSFPY